MNLERRVKRSPETNTALQLLVEAVHQRSDVRAVALIDSAGTIRAGSGSLDDAALNLVTKVARGERATLALLDAMAEEDDLLVRSFQAGGERISLAAIGTRVRRMPDAVSAAQRILRA